MCRGCRLQPRHLNEPAWKPDFGPDRFPPDKGATIIGARLPIVNFKAYLGTPSEEAAERVAKVLSDPATGFSGVHFYPALDRTRNEALLNITVGNFQATPLYRVLESVKTELRRFGTRVTRVEMVGLVPMQALIASAEHADVLQVGARAMRSHTLLEAVGQCSRSIPGRRRL